MESLVEKNIKDIISKYNKFFLSKKNVFAIGLGQKFIKNINTHELCLKIFVEKKEPSNVLLEKDLIPKNFLGIKLDVMELGEINYFFNSYDNDTANNNLAFSPEFLSRIRPIQSGCSISQYKKKTWGTLGAIVFGNKYNTPYILSNYHVMGGSDKQTSVAPILQPAAVFDGVNNFNIIATVTRSIPLEPISSNLANFVDCAIAKILPYVKYTKNIFNIGEILGTSIPKLNNKIKKVGARTGYTEGKILAINVISNSTINGNKYYYKDQILVSRMSDSGDSGSVYVNSYNKAIGLGFGGAKNGTFLNPIDLVLNVLKVHF
ncbi:hypothetical protein [Clostridium tarantellae]|uniref:Serine protease n=1 Tax=Clostridium tarantellae TaxID=39493 RepID=A0A6I1MRU4_9CLOT|nr:hypothetical protein [Clostridium tarantellae]MPQ43611.1 hypothetical protein [Clostridium tarantellae]